MMPDAEGSVVSSESHMYEPVTNPEKRWIMQVTRTRQAHIIAGKVQ